MTRYLLDTNIISNVTKAAPSESLLAWMAEQIDDDLFISSLTIAEIRRGILEKPAGRRRNALEAWFAGPEGPSALFAGRVLPFDETAGLVWARLMLKAVPAARSTPSSPRPQKPTAVSSSGTTSGTFPASRPSTRFGPPAAIDR